MPSWGEIATEIASVGPAQLTGGLSQFDFVRRKYLVGMHALTGRATILYATKWTLQSPGISPGMLSIGPNDIHGTVQVR